MKFTAFLILMLFPFWLVAQYNYVLSTPISNGLHLLKLGDKAILIHPLDAYNQSHKWITFDSTLAAVSTKKLITPEAQNIISQNYLEGANSIIRIDQFFIDGQLQVSAFVFDVNGNLLRSKQVENIFFQDKKLLAKPFTIAQSPDKKSVSLVQSLVGVEFLSVSCIVFNDQLTITSNTNFTLPFDGKLFEVYGPVINNDQNVFLPIADKFNSYKLGAVLYGYLLSPGEKSPLKIPFEFDRKKLKNLTFQFTGNNLVFSALFSQENNKAHVAGVLFSGYDLIKNQKLATDEYIFSDAVKSSLKKNYGLEGRKGNLLNYLSIIPEAFFSNSKQGYAVLLPDQQTPVFVPRSSPAYLPNLNEIRQQQAYISSLTRRTLPGASRPMDAAEAMTYAAMNPRPTTVDNYDGWRPKESSSPSNQKNYDKNLLFFDFKKEQVGSGYRFLKMKYSDDPDYQFFTYVPAVDGYGALHYIVPSFGKPFIRSSVINAEGVAVEKKIFEDKSKILLHDYPWLINKESLTAFYEDRNTGQMGLIKIRL
jgi:hypothetical protein